MQRKEGVSQTLKSEFWVDQVQFEISYNGCMKAVKAALESQKAGYDECASIYSEFLFLRYTCLAGPVPSMGQSQSQ